MSLRLEKTPQVGWFFWLLGDEQMFPLCFSSGSCRGNREGKKMPTLGLLVSSLLATETRDQFSSLPLPWKHISACCRRRCHGNCFHFILMLCYVQESINKMQVGGTWLCLTTGNSSFSCSEITATLSVCALFDC